MDRRYLSGRIALLPVLLMILFCWGPATAATLTVCPSGCNYTSIQDAIDDASAGDTIEVMNGTYTELLTIDKTLTIAGEDPATTIISGNYSGNVVTVTADDVSISGLTITKGSTTLVPNVIFYGIGGIEVTNLSVRNCIVTNSSVGILAENVTGFSVSESEVADCVSQGMLLSNTTDARVIGNIVCDNLFGIMAAWTESLTCMGNDIAHNQYDGLCLIDGVTNSVVEDNQIRENCYLNFNDTGDFNQAGAYFEFVEDSTIRDNILLHNGGIAFFISKMEDSVVEGNVMDENFAGFSYNDQNTNPNNTIYLTNTVNTAPILYLEDASNQEITGGSYSCVYLVSCDNMTVHDLDLADRNGLGIMVRGGSGIQAIRNNVSHNAFQNILFSLVSDGSITGNTVSDAMYGIGVLESVNVTVAGNTASGNVHGLGVASPCHKVHLDGNIASGNDIGISFEFATGDGKNTGISSTGNQISGITEGEGLGINLMDSQGIYVRENQIHDLYEGIWVDGGLHHTISSQTIRNSTFGIEMSFYTEGTGEGTPARHNLITGNEVTARKNAFFTDGDYPRVYGNRIYLNSFSSDQEPMHVPNAQAPALAGQDGNAVAWGLPRTATLARPADDESEGSDKPNILNTDKPVIYRYHNVYYTGYLGNYWNWSNGTDTAGNGVRSVPYQVITNNTDNYPLVDPASAYLAGPAPAFYANFTASPLEGQAPLTVQFTDISNGNPTSWRYSLGDGLSTSARNPTYTYRIPGNYTVSLTVWKMEGGKLVNTTTVKPLYLTIAGSPATTLEANFTASPLGGPAPLTVQFTDTSTDSPDHWKYSFGDGSSSMSRNPTHVYRAPGNYTVTLTVIKMEKGTLLKNTTTRPNLIEVFGQPVPDMTANFTASPKEGPAPLKVTFTDASTGNPDFWKYEFGDGMSTQLKNPSHTYRLPGNYTVTLTVSKMRNGVIERNTTVVQDLVLVR